MTSIFDLKTNIDELSSTNEGTSKMEYEQHPPTRDITTTNFANGAIHFRFQVSGQKWWIPSRSYIRTRFELTDGAGTQLTTGAGIAPNMGMMASLFQSAEFRINDKTVSRVSDFMPQVDALETRLTKSNSWLETVGEATNWWETKQAVRQAEVSSDGAIIVDQVPTVATETTVVQTAIAGGGYDATTTVAYDAGTGVITFAVATNDTNIGWAVGDFITLTGGVGLTVDGVRNVRMEVLVVNAGDTMTVRAEGAVDQGAGVITFTRTRPNAPAIAPPSRQIGIFETTWTPPLSLFKIAHAIPSGRYELVLNPQTGTSFQKRAIESLLGTASKDPTLPGGTAKDFKLSIVNMYLYTATVEGPRADDITYLLDLEQTRCQSEKIDSDSFQQKNFDVSPSTYALTVAYQDLRAGEHTAISASKFKSYEDSLTPSVNQELKLNRFFINYAGQNLPAPDADPSFVAGTDYTIQRYTETQIYSGAYYDTGGAETIQEFHDRGSYYYFSWPRDGTDRSTRVNVHQQFVSLTTDFKFLRVLLFDHSKQVARIRVQDGRVVDVQVEDA